MADGTHLNKQRRKMAEKRGRNDKNSKNTNTITDFSAASVGLDCSHTLQVYLHQISARSDQDFNAQLTSKIDFRSISRNIAVYARNLEKVINRKVGSTRHKT